MADTFRVKGQVRDLHGILQPNARVKFALRNTAFGVNFVVPAHQSDFITGPDGFFQADLIEGDYMVAVSFDGRPRATFPMNIPEGREGFIEVLPFGSAKILSDGTIALAGTGPVTATFSAPTSTGSAPIATTLEATLAGSSVSVTGPDGNGTTTIAKAASPQTLTATWTVQADVGDAATSAASVTVPAYAVPDAMAAPVATVLGSTSISFARAAAPFDGGTAVTGYNAYYTVNGGSVVTVADAPDPTVITGLSSGDVVALEHRAVNAAGEGPAGATATATTTITAPAPMAAPTATTITSSSILFTRAAAPNDGGSAITSYNAYYTINGGATVSVTGIGATFTVSGLAPGDDLLVETRAVNSVGEGAAGAILAASSLPIAPTAPLAPALASTGATTLLATLAPDEADGGSAITDRTLSYTVNGGAAVTVTGLAAEATHTITGMSAGDTVVARVDVTNAAGTTQGATATAQTWQVPDQMAAPTLIGGAGEATLEWPAAPNLNGRDLVTNGYRYEITLAADTGFASVVASGQQANLTDTSITPLEAGSYIARVWAVTDAGSGVKSDASAAETVTATGLPPAGATSITFANAGNLFSRTDPLFDVGAFDGNNAATVVFTLTATTGEPVYVRLQDESGNVVPVDGEMFTLLGNGTGAEADYSLPNVAAHPDLLTPEFYLAAGTWQASPRSFQAGSRIIFWTQSLGAREQSEANGTFNLAAQPPMDGTIAGRINFFTRSGYTEGISESKPTVAVRTTIADTSPPANQTSSVSAMADTLHSIAPTHRYEVVMQSIAGSDWNSDLTDDQDANRKWSNEVQVHNLAVSDKNPGGLIVWSWIYSPSALGANYTAQFLAFAFGTAGVGAASTYDHTLIELYGDYTGYKIAHDMPILCGETYRPSDALVGTAWQSSIDGSDGATRMLAINRENISQQVRELHTQSAAAGKMLPPLANTAGFLCGNDGTNSGDFIHPGYTAGTGVDGQQRFMRGHGLKAAEALGLFSGPGKVEFTDAEWNYAGNTVTLTARNEAGTTVPVTSLRALLGESQPAGRPAYHTDNLVGFEVADANSIQTVSGITSYRTRETVPVTINGPGQVVVDYSGAAVASIPDHRKRVIFGGGLGFGNREQATDFTNEMWKDNAVVGFTSPDGVIRERPVSPFPDPALLTPYDPQSSLENLFDLAPNVWTEDEAGGSVSGDRTALTFTDTSGNGECRMAAHILNDVLTEWESGGSFILSFWSAATTRILVRASNENDGTQVNLYDSTGGHGTSSAPVTLTTAFPFNIGPVFNVRLKILCIGMPANGSTTLNAITPSWTPA